MAQQLLEACLQEALVTSYAGDRGPGGLFSGTGTATFSNGQQYEGAWEGGNMHGTGTLRFPDGACWAGQMHCSTITGRGVYAWGDATYEGDLVGGVRHGVGRLTFADGPAVYEGGWRQGRRHGRGVVWYDAAKESCYEGDWDDDQPHGLGRARYPSGSTYSGHWCRGSKEGVGSMTWAGAGQTYCGEWLGDRPHGRGVLLWHAPQHAARAASHAVTFMCNRYEGAFQAGQRHGEGTLYYADGSRYEGQWQRDQKHGDGLFVSRQGLVWAGAWAADKPCRAAGAPPEAPPLTQWSQQLRPAGSPRGGTTPIAKDAAKPAAATAATARATPSSAPSRTSTATPSRQGSQQSSRPASRVTAPGTASSSTSRKVPPRLGTAPSAPSPSPSPAPVPPASGGPAGLDPPIGGGGSMHMPLEDLLEDVSCPAATQRGVEKLLSAYSSELRVLYDRYSAASSPHLAAEGPSRFSWALTTAQFWELVREADLLGRQVPLRAVSAVLSRVRAPPKAVEERRRRVAETEPTAPFARAPTAADHDPHGQLLYREVCEALVRVAPLRYPQLPSLERQLQQVMSHNLLPLAAACGLTAAGAVAAASSDRSKRLPLASQSQRSGGAPAPAPPSPSWTPSADGGGCWAVGVAAAARCAAPPDPLAGLSSPLVAGYLRGRLAALAGVFTDIAEGRWGAASPSAAASPTDTADAPCGGGCAAPSAGDCGSAAASAGGGGAALLGGVQQLEGFPRAQAEGEELYARTATARRIVAALAAAGVLRPPLGVGAAAWAMLEGLLGGRDPEAHRLRLEAAEPPEPAGSEADEAAAAAAEADAARAEQRLRCALLWADAPLTFPEFVWGLARCAALLPLPGAGGAASPRHGAAAAPGADRQLLAKLQSMLEGDEWQLLSRMQQPRAAGTAASTNDNAVGDEEQAPLA